MNQTEYRFEIDSEGALRVDKFLSDNLPEISRSQIKQMIEAGAVTLDGEQVTKAGTKAKPGSILEIVVSLNDADGLVPEAIELDILYEDNDVIVLNKPAGMVVHPGAGNQSGTLVNGLLHHCPEIRHTGESDRPGVVHRLDKDTSGVMVFAKNDKAYRWLVKQFKSRDLSKTYLTLVDGRPPTPSGRIEAPIERDTKNRTRMAVGLRGQGKSAVSEYFELQRFEKHTLLEVHPITGRTHQIRVHLAYLGTPVVGDTLYGRRKPSIEIPRFFLHANSLDVRLPGNRVLNKFKAPLPGDLQSVIDSLQTQERKAV